MSDFIPVFQFTKKDKTKRERIYRFIREHRLKEGVDFKIMEKVVKRTYVRNDLLI
jgi:hypothetical protein